MPQPPSNLNTDTSAERLREAQAELRSPGAGQDMSQWKRFAEKLFDGLIAQDAESGARFERLEARVDELRGLGGRAGEMPVEEGQNLACKESTDGMAFPVKHPQTTKPAIAIQHIPRKPPPRPQMEVTTQKPSPEAVLSRLSTFLSEPQLLLDTKVSPDTTVRDVVVAFSSYTDKVYLVGDKAWINPDTDVVVSLLDPKNRRAEVRDVTMDEKISDLVQEVKGKKLRLKIDAVANPNIFQSRLNVAPAPTSSVDKPEEGSLDGETATVKLEVSLREQSMAYINDFPERGIGATTVGDTHTTDRHRSSAIKLFNSNFKLPHYNLDLDSVEDAEDSPVFIKLEDGSYEVEHVIRPKKVGKIRPTLKRARENWLKEIEVERERKRKAGEKEPDTSFAISSIPNSERLRREEEEKRKEALAERVLRLKQEKLRREEEEETQRIEKRLKEEREERESRERMAQQQKADEAQAAEEERIRLEREGRLRDKRLKEEQEKNEALRVQREKETEEELRQQETQRLKELARMEKLALEEKSAHPASGEIPTSVAPGDTYKFQRIGKNGKPIKADPKKQMKPRNRKEKKAKERAGNPHVRDPRLTKLQTTLLNPGNDIEKWKAAAEGLFDQLIGRDAEGRTRFENVEDDVDMLRDERDSIYNREIMNKATNILVKKATGGSKTFNDLKSEEGGRPGVYNYLLPIFLAKSENSIDGFGLGRYTVTQFLYFVITHNSIRKAGNDTAHGGTKEQHQASIDSLADSEKVQKEKLQLAFDFVVKFNGYPGE
ncbi:hypothetical protein BJ508DRAFT_310858 [Ascobolus immersus RN42]|uniref:Uncharacterized protein n=1 Tax=Ascobolus immersus RN42 TaxID=1160509 RepID=A0A3N4HS22_ASCIM|nr:hypothetical protein BJ508DRAFT_310858 [Ascobolus immersus RN42]